MFDKAPEKRSLKVVNKKTPRCVRARMRKDTHTGYKLECGACTNENYESCFCVTGESVVKHCTTAAAVVAGERASEQERYEEQMFDKAPEKRSLIVVNKRLRGVSALE